MAVDQQPHSWSTQVATMYRTRQEMSEINMTELRLCDGFEVYRFDRCE